MPDAFRWSANLVEPESVSKENSQIYRSSDAPLARPGRFQSRFTIDMPAQASIPLSMKMDSRLRENDKSAFDPDFGITVLARCW